MKTGERGGNGGPWETKENQNQVSLRFPLALGNRCRDSHIPTAPATNPLLRPKTNKKKPKKGAQQSASLISTLQAHSWIRKCSVSLV
jgi:hypothetical protein